MTISATRSPFTQELRSVDRELLGVLRRGDPVGIGELIEALGVTATAVRQRIERLLEMGLIEREKIVAGRGRPTFQYRLTVVGHQRAGANPAEIADAMWQEILAIEDDEVRQKLLSAVADRLGRQYAAQLSDASDGRDEDSFERRMNKLAEMLSARHVVSEVSHSGELPVLDVGTCPYPSLTDISDDRAMCRLEEKVFSEALGKPVHLSSCRLDGDACCQFQAVDQTAESSN